MNEKCNKIRKARRNLKLNCPGLWLYCSLGQAEQYIYEWSLFSNWTEQSSCTARVALGNYCLIVVATLSFLLYFLIK